MVTCTSLAERKWKSSSRTPYLKPFISLLQLADRSIQRVDLLSGTARALRSLQLVILCDECHHRSDHFVSLGLGGSPKLSKLSLLLLLLLLLLQAKPGQHSHASKPAVALGQHLLLLMLRRCRLLKQHHGVTAL